MSNSRIYVMGLIFCVAMFCVFLAGSQVLRGQSRSSPQGDEIPPVAAGPAYHYVGVEQTIAWIDPATGKIEILSQRNLSRSSLLAEHSRPWEWRKIKVKSNRSGGTVDSVTGGRGALAP